MNLWLIVTISAVFIISALGAYLGVRAIRTIRTAGASQGDIESGEKIPMALLQQRALWNILSIFIGIAIMFWLFLGHTVTDFFQDTALRISLTVVLTATLLVNLFLMLPTTKKGKWAKHFDERDELVLNRASNFQIIGILILSVIWTVGLTEYYWDAGSIPIDFPYLMFWSNFLMLFLSRSIGIVYGYWWIDRYGN